MLQYRVELDDRAQAEVEDAVFGWTSRLGPEWATRWYAQLLQAIADLSEMPRRFAVSDDDAAAYPALEVRRMLYGKGRIVYRVLFHVIEPQGGETEGVVRILRIRHAAMKPLGQADEDQDL